MNSAFIDQIFINSSCEISIANIRAANYKLKFVESSYLNSNFAIELAIFNLLIG